MILMQDIRALLYDGRFAIPTITLFQGIPWGEGSMSTLDVRHWIQREREHASYWYSSDYSKFDTSQAGWLIEDVFNKVIRPLFGQLSDEDEQWFQVMVNSYIHKDIDSFDGRIHIDGCQVSGSLMTYAINTIVNEIVDRTALIMQGCDYRKFRSLKCGDDNLTYYPASEPWNARKHCEIILRYFGIRTTLGETDHGRAKDQDPHFLSRTWTRGGEWRPLIEVLWNLVKPERRRVYNPSVTNISVKRAEALVMFCAYLEQDKLMREYFDVDRIRYDAIIDRKRPESAYQVLASMGSGFRTPWINFTTDIRIVDEAYKRRWLKSSA